MTRETAIQNTSPNEIQIKSAPASQAQQVAANSWSYVPAIDVIELQDEYTIACDTPGIAPDQICLTYENGVLNLHAPVPARNAADAKFLRQEYGVGDFDRTIPLGRIVEFIDGDRINASYEHGVLTVHLPKLAKSRKIQVKAS
jgi:HSP20 family protein